VLLVVVAVAVAAAFDCFLRAANRPSPGILKYQGCEM